MSNNIVDPVLETKFEKFIRSTMGEMILYENDIEVFIKLLAYIQSQIYSDTQKLPELRDIDLAKTEYLNYFQKEVGLALPDTQVIDIREFIRESKAWYSGKGTVPIYDFIGSLTNTLVEMFEPSKLIFRTSSVKTLLSGEVNHDPNTVSKLGRMRDGIIWAFHTYFLNVTGVQNLVSVKALTDLVKLVHPAGTQYFLNLNQTQEAVSPTAIGYKSTDWREDRFSLLGNTTLDNQFYLDGISRLSQFSPYEYRRASYAVTIGKVDLAYSYRNPSNAVIMSVHNDVNLSTVTSTTVNPAMIANVQYVNAASNTYLSLLNKEFGFINNSTHTIDDVIYPVALVTTVGNTVYEIDRSSELLKSGSINSIAQENYSSLNSTKYKNIFSRAYNQPLYITPEFYSQLYLTRIDVAPL